MKRLETLEVETLNKTKETHMLNNTQSREKEELKGLPDVQLWLGKCKTLLTPWVSMKVFKKNEHRLRQHHIKSGRAEGTRTKSVVTLHPSRAERLG